MAVLTEPDGIRIFTTGVMGVTGLVAPCTLVTLAGTKSGLVNTGMVVGIMVVNNFHTKFRIQTSIMAEVTAACLTMCRRSRCYQRRCIGGNGVSVVTGCFVSQCYAQFATATVSIGGTGTSTLACCRTEACSTAELFTPKRIIYQVTVTYCTLTRLGGSAFLVVDSWLVEPGHVTLCTVSFHEETDDSTGVVFYVTVQTAIVGILVSVTVCI